jgi:DNA gyrase/topoisomerase IV subunit B
MNADQLASTTMNKKSRLLLQVHIDDPLVVEKRIGVLMGKDAHATLELDSGERRLR